MSVRFKALRHCLVPFLGATALVTTSAIAQVEPAPANLEEIAARIAQGDASASPLFLSQAERRQAFAHVDKIMPTRHLAASTAPYTLPISETGLADVPYTFNGEGKRLTELLASDALMGMVAVHDGEIVLEHYATDHNVDSRWVSFSVTKSVTSMLIGAALQDGYINSIDDSVVDYLPRLKGSAYDSVSIRDLLHMASGVAWNEDYTDPESDVAIAGAVNGRALTTHLDTLPRVAPPGDKFNYNTGEANLTGEVLRAAIASSAVPYLRQKIWQPFGMARDAHWLLDSPDGRETGGCCISATTRDYARLGLFAMADGVLPDGTRVLPEGWMRDSTQPFADEPSYGYMWWLLGDGRFAALGIFEQTIFVDPKANLVIAVHSNAETASGSIYGDELMAALLAVSDQLRGEPAQ